MAQWANFDVTSSMKKLVSLNHAKGMTRAHREAGSPWLPSRAAHHRPGAREARPDYRPAHQLTPTHLDRAPGTTARPARRAHRATTAMSEQPASARYDTSAADPIEARIREQAKTEWGVADERGRITACESEQAARQLQAACGGELVYRRTWITTWS